MIIIYFIHKEKVKTILILKKLNNIMKVTKVENKAYFDENAIKKTVKIIR